MGYEVDMEEEPLTVAEILKGSKGEIIIIEDRHTGNKLTIDGKRGIIHGRYKKRARNLRD